MVPVSFHQYPGEQRYNQEGSRYYRDYDPIVVVSLGVTRSIDSNPSCSVSESFWLCVECAAALSRSQISCSLGATFHKRSLASVEHPKAASLRSSELCKSFDEGRHAEAVLQSNHRSRERHP